MKEEVLYTVVIEVEEMNVSSFDMREIQNIISDLTNIEAERIRIRFDTNDKNEITHIIVIVDDKTTAERVRNMINMAIDEDNHEELFRHFKSARVEVNELPMSRGCIIEKEDELIIGTIVFLTLFNYFFSVVNVCDNCMNRTKP